MTILKKRFKARKEVDAYLIGAKVPKRLASYLSLYCLAKEKTKTSVLKPLIEDWIKKQQEGMPISDLVQIIARKAYKIWQGFEHKQNFHTFKMQLKNELILKDLEEYSEEILNLLMDEKNKET